MISIAEEVWWGRDMNVALPSFIGNRELSWVASRSESPTASAERHPQSG